MKREHGVHNKLVCDKLYLETTVKCNDWVVTTSFYSSIHFIDHALFPCEYNGNVFNDINEAHSVINNKSKHQTRAILLNKILPKHKSDYEFLISESQNARYSNYDVNPLISNKAYRSLENIVKSYDREKNKIEKESN